STRSSTATTGPSASASRGLLRRGLGPALLDDADDPVRRLFDRQLGDLDHRAAEPAVDRLGVLELLVDLEQLRVVPGGADVAHAGLPDLREPAGLDREPDDLVLRNAEEGGRRLDSADDRDVRGLVAEVAQIHRQRRLRRARDADE